MNMYVAARERRPVSLKQLSKWMKIYPLLRELVEVEIDMRSSSFRIQNADALLGHLYELHERVVQGQASHDSHGGHA